MTTTLNAAAVTFLLRENLIEESNAADRMALAQQRVEERFGISAIDFFTQQYDPDEADDFIVESFHCD